MPTRSLSRCAKPRHLGQRRGPSDIQPVEAVELLAERGIGLGLGVYLFEFGQRVDQGLGHEPAAEPAEIRAVMLRQRTAFRHLHTPAGLHQPLDGQIMTFGGGHALAHQHGVRAGAGVVLQLHRPNTPDSATLMTSGGSAAASSR